MEKLETIVWTSIHDSLPEKEGKYLCQVEMTVSGDKIIAMENYYRHDKQVRLNEKEVLFKETDELTFCKHPAYAVTYWADVKGPTETK